ncbi:MAG: amidohydrolase family protein [Clostridiaceae bacterium]|nr:amidohydrolase family protein [Clostridiaceae bacterium]
MLLKNALYLDKELEFKHGHILIVEDMITSIYDHDKDVQYTGEIFDCSNYFVLPGLINAHSHNPATLARGLFRDMELKDWLNESFQGGLQEKLFNYLDESVDSEDFKTLCFKAYSEYIKQGITYIVESGQADHSEKATIKCLREIGLKGTIDLYETYEDNVSLASDSIKVCTHFPEEEDITEEWVEFCRLLEEKHRPILMTHCLETKWRKDLIMEKFNCSTVKLLDRENLLNSRTVLFHCVHVNEEDMDTIAEKGASIAYCPVSNMWSKAGEAPIHEFLRKNINVLLGTDFIYQDIWEVMRLTYYNLKLKSETRQYTAKDVFRMITQNPNNKVGNHMNTGSIHEGFKADLMFIDRNDTKLLPIVDNERFSNILHNILLNCREEMIRHVIIDGKWVIQNRKLTMIDETVLNQEYRKLSEKLINNWITDKT